MRIPFFAGFSKRPVIDAQNTGRDVYERPLGPASVTVNGWGGFSNIRSLSPISQASTNQPFVTPATVTGVGNDFNANPELDPLSDKQNGSNRTQF